MQYPVMFASLLLVASIHAQEADFNAITTPTLDEVVVAGSLFSIDWQAPEKYREGTISIDLISGDSPGTLTPAKNIASGVANSAEKFDWAVDETLGDDNTYGLKLALESDPNVFQYSMPFKIDRSNSKPTTVSGGSAASGLHMVKSTPLAMPSTKKILITLSNATAEAPKGEFNGTSFRSPGSPSSGNPTVEPGTPSYSGVTCGPGLPMLLGFLLVGLAALL